VGCTFAALFIVIIQDSGQDNGVYHSTSPHLLQ